MEKEIGGVEPPCASLEGGRKKMTTESGPHASQPSGWSPIFSPSEEETETPAEAMEMDGSLLGVETKED
ncbi:unnamed protein product [Linum trigynum]|uniref:Uncharacterized protein n=1 Tax=Linum trigynum TaxID=586398 RepID=A0AAV2EDK0_9ROSI